MINGEHVDTGNNDSYVSPLIIQSLDCFKGQFTGNLNLAGGFKHVFP